MIEAGETSRRRRLRVTQLQALHDDHTSLRPAVEALRSTADAVDGSSLADLRGAVEADRIYLHAELLPHLEAEEEVLYPALRDAMGSETVTVGMEHDHAQIRAHAAEVAEIDVDLTEVERLSPELATRIRRVFYGLYAIVLNHFAKEEAVYHPYLTQHLSPAAQAAVAAEFDRAVTRRVLDATS
jgi:iron-sulfur cluster repair protein YtfE (RIC family)